MAWRWTWRSASSAPSGTGKALASCSTRAATVRCAQLGPQRLRVHPLRGQELLPGLLSPCSRRIWS